MTPESATLRAFRARRARRARPPRAAAALGAGAPACRVTSARGECCRALGAGSRPCRGRAERRAERGNSQPSGRSGRSRSKGPLDHLQYCETRSAHLTALLPSQARARPGREAAASHSGVARAPAAPAARRACSSTGWAGNSARLGASQHTKHHAAAAPQQLEHDVDLDTLPLVALDARVVDKVGNCDQQTARPCMPMHAHACPCLPSHGAAAASADRLSPTAAAAGVLCCRCHLQEARAAAEGRR